MKKYTVFIILIYAVLLSGCASSTYSLKDEEILFNDPVTNNKIITLKLDNKNIRYNSTFCSTNNYTIKQDFNDFGNLFLEYIQLDLNCEWNGLSRGYYKSFFKEKSKIDTMKLVKRFDIKNYEFSQYKLDDKYLINLIFIWSADESTFILDSKGKFTATLLEKLSSKIKLPIGDKNIDLEFNDSLAKENWIRGYFKKEEILYNKKI